MDELYHYGVKGMKWGIRRTPAQLGHDLVNYRRNRVAKKVERRREKANRIAETANRTAPGSSRAIKTAIKAAKKKESRYGQTNPGIVGEAFVRSMGLSLVTSIASSAALASGREGAATAINVLGGGANIGVTGNMIYKLYKNYD